MTRLELHYIYAKINLSKIYYLSDFSICIEFFQKVTSIVSVNSFV